MIIAEAGKGEEKGGRNVSCRVICDTGVKFKFYSESIWELLTVLNQEGDSSDLFYKDASKGSRGSYSFLKACC